MHGIRHMAVAAQAILTGVKLGMRSRAHEGPRLHGTHSTDFQSGKLVMIQSCKRWLDSSQVAHSATMLVRSGRRCQPSSIHQAKQQAVSQVQKVVAEPIQVQEFGWPQQDPAQSFHNPGDRGEGPLVESPIKPGVENDKGPDESGHLRVPCNALGQHLAGNMANGSVNSASKP